MIFQQPAEDPDRAHCGRFRPDGTARIFLDLGKQNNVYSANLVFSSTEVLKF
jgi:hypothetical protein